MEKLEQKLGLEKEGIIGLLSGEINHEEKEAGYGGLELVKDKEYAGGTSIQCWM